MINGENQGQKFVTSVTLDRVKRYYQENTEKMWERSWEYFKKTKADPEKYKLYLEQKRQKYKEKIQNLFILSKNSIDFHQT